MTMNQDPIALTPPSTKNLRGYYEHIEYYEYGERFEETLELGRKVFSWSDLHDSYYDAIRTNEKGKWKYWLLRPQDKQERSAFIKRFGEDRLPENISIEKEGYLGVMAYVETIGISSEDITSHLDPGEDGEHRKREGRTRLFRVLVHPDRDSIALAENNCGDLLK